MRSGSGAGRALTWSGNLGLINRHHASKNARSQASNKSADKKHGHVVCSSTETSSQDQDDAPNLHCAFSTIMVRGPGLGKATSNGPRRVHTVQRANDVGGRSVTRFPLGGQAKIRVEVRLPNGGSNDGQAICGGNGSQSDEYDHPEVIRIDNDLMQHDGGSLVEKEYTESRMEESLSSILGSFESLSYTRTHATSWQRLVEKLGTTYSSMEMVAPPNSRFPRI